LVITPTFAASPLRDRPIDARRAAVESAYSVRDGAVLGKLTDDVVSTRSEVEERTRRVTRPFDILLDFGGFLKGRTVDQAAALACSPVMIDAGGDAMLRGAGIDGPAGAYQLFVPWQPVLAQVRAVAFHVPFAIFTSCTPLIWRSALTMFMPASTTSA
jgi:hypothetical protein